MKKFVFISILCLLTIVQNIFAQKSSTADQLYNQGISSMKTMTVASQDKAISAFEKAKVAYDSAEKKKLCDNQIAKCTRNKRWIVDKNNGKKKPQKVEEKPKVVEEKSQTVESTKNEGASDIVSAKPNDKERITLNPSEITISAKGGKYIEISVDSNDKKWKVESCPEWLTYTASNTKLLIKAEKNKDKKNERAGIVVVVAGKMKAELLVKQSKSGIKVFGIEL